jgi:3-methyladenine DNA glycosylase AlkD
MDLLKDLKNELEILRNPEKVKILQGFFKTGKGEYGEGDVFFGITVPESRIVAKKYTKLGFKEIQELLYSNNHEYRFVALLVLMQKYNQAKKLKSLVEQEKIFNFYLENAKKGRINNWDLVDVTCRDIIGDYLIDKSKEILYDLAKGGNLWEKRIAIVSTWSFIRLKDFKTTLAISEVLLEDSHDLIHKAVGWMLREIGKRDENVLCKFLNKHYKNMPRTMLRYSIERLDKNKKDFYMTKN